jgi:hypothetical protein
MDAGGMPNSEDAPALPPEGEPQGSERS